MTLRHSARVRARPWGIGHPGDQAEAEHTAGCSLRGSLSHTFLIRHAPLSSTPHTEQSVQPPLCTQNGMLSSCTVQLTLRGGRGQPGGGGSLGTNAAPASHPIPFSVEEASEAVIRSEPSAPLTQASIALQSRPARVAHV